MFVRIVDFTLEALLKDLLVVCGAEGNRGQGGERAHQQNIGRLCITSFLGQAVKEDFAKPSPGRVLLRPALPAGNWGGYRK